MVADPRAVAARSPDSRWRMLCEIAMLVTEGAVDAFAGASRQVAHRGLSDDELLHAIALSAFFGHLNRIADAVAVPLDYDVRHQPPHAEPATPLLPRAPVLRRGSPALAIEARPATAAALAAWRDYILARAPENHAIAACVAELLVVGVELGEVAFDVGLCESSMGGRARARRRPCCRLSDAGRGRALRAGSLASI